MTARRASSGKQKYYKPPSTLAKLRHRLADGTPTHSLLHYLHGREKLPEDVKVIAEAAEKLHQVRELLSEVREDGGVGEVSGAVRYRSKELRAMIDGKASNLIRDFLTAARRALIIKTMREPDER